MRLSGLSIEMSTLVVAIGLGFIQLVLAAQLANAQRGLRWAASARDANVPPLTGAAGRAARAFSNFLETFAFFAASVLAAEVTGHHNHLTQWGAELYVLARVVYVPLYLAGIPLVRSLAWNVAAAGIFMLMAGIVWP